MGGLRRSTGVAAVAVGVARLENARGDRRQVTGKSLRTSPLLLQPRARNQEGDDRPIPQHQVRVLDWGYGAARRRGRGDQTDHHATDPCHGVSRLHGPKLTAQPGR